MVVSDSAELHSNLVIGVRVIGIDEVQFFDEKITDVCMELADAGVRVVVAGLDQDYLRRPFGPDAGAAVSSRVRFEDARCMCPLRRPWSLLSTSRRRQFSDRSGGTLRTKRDAECATNPIESKPPVQKRFKRRKASRNQSA